MFVEGSGAATTSATTPTMSLCLSMPMSVAPTVAPIALNVTSVLTVTAAAMPVMTSANALLIVLVYYVPPALPAGIACK